MRLRPNRLRSLSRFRSPRPAENFHLQETKHAWQTKSDVSESSHDVAHMRQCAPIPARPAGLEPATLGLEIPCSIQLSYGRKMLFSAYLIAFFTLLAPADRDAVKPVYYRW